MIPVEIEFLMRDKASPDAKKFGKTVDDVDQTVENVSKSVKAKIEEQRKVIKLVEADVKSLEKEFEKLAPGKTKMDMSTELNAAKKVLQEEKNILEGLNRQYEETSVKAKRLTTDLREMQEELARMRMEGKQSSEAYQELSAKAAQLADTLGDVRNETKILAHDDAGIQGVISGVSGMAGAFTVATGIMGVFAGQNEDLIKIQTKVQSVMAITMGLQQVMNTLNKDSQFRLHTVVKVKNLLINANKRLAVSLGISNAAAKALMGTLTLGLSVAIAALIKMWDNYSREQEKAAEKRKELLEVEKDGRATMFKTRVEIDQNIRSIKDFTGSKEQEKRKVDELNRKYGESFGYYNTIAGWYDILIQKSEAYTQMLYLEAKAQASLNKAIQTDEKVTEIEQTPEDEFDSFWKSSRRVLGNWFKGESNDLNADWGRKNKYDAWNAARMKRDAYLQEAETFQNEMAEISQKIHGGNFKPVNESKSNSLTLAELELKARRKIEDNAVGLIKDSYDRQRQEADLSFQREKQRITDEEKQRLELYEKLQKAGQPVTKEQKDNIISQSVEQLTQAKDIYEQTLAGINTSEKLELEDKNKYIQDALTQYQTYYQERLSTLAKFQKDRETLEKGGATAGQYTELDYQQEQALSAIDEKFAMREDSFKSWADSIINLSVNELGRLLHEAQQELDRLEFLNPNDPKLATLRVQVARYNQEIQKQNRQRDTGPEKDSIKRWQSLQKILSRCSREFSDLSKEVEGTGGEILSAAGEIAVSTVSIIDSITQLGNLSVESTKQSAEGASKAIQAVEKASVILAIIGAAIQLMQKLSSLMKDEHQQYLDYAAKVNEINIMRDAVLEYELAVLKAKNAEKSWFATDNLKGLQQAREEHEKINKLYFEKLTEQQAIYQNESGSGWLTGALKFAQNLANIMSLQTLTDKIFGTNVSGKLNNMFGGKTYQEGTTSAMNNLRIETRKKSKGFLGTGIGGKSQKTEDLITWTKNNLGLDLFDDSGFIDTAAAKQVLDKYGDKLVGQTKETLESLVEMKEQYDEYMEQLREYVSSLYEPLVDNFIDSLWDWFDNGKDALDSFKEYASGTFRDIVSDMMRTIILEKVLNGFDKDISDMYEKYSQGFLSEEQLMDAVAKRTEGLIDNYEKNIPALQEIMENVTGMFKEAGIDLKQSEETSQSGRSGAFTTMSQETGTKLEGLFTSVQMHLANIDELVDNIGESLGNALNHLAKIEENTGTTSKTLTEMKEQLEYIIREGVITK